MKRYKPHSPRNLENGRPSEWSNRTLVLSIVSEPIAPNNINLQKLETVYSSPIPPPPPQKNKKQISNKIGMWPNKKAQS